VNISGVVALFAGGKSTCVRQADGAVSCWGLRAGPANSTASPTVVPGFENAISIALSQGFLFGCAAYPEEPPKCWAGGSYSMFGVRGNGDVSDGLQAPVVGMGDGQLVESPDGFIGVGAVCAVDTAGVAFCWGNNQSGHLGNASPDSALFPERVLFP
jgi:hypothetical protein